jgi:hypothetical protein
MTAAVRVATHTGCGHIFHASCIGAWIDKQWESGPGPAHSVDKLLKTTRCPTCREIGRR